MKPEKTFIILPFVNRTRNKTYQKLLRLAIMGVNLIFVPFSRAVTRYLRKQIGPATIF